MSLFRNATVLRAFSVFCLIEFCTNIVTPSISWALTAGPTAPEATSFEPVDTTDLVSLNTGDLTYTLPLLDVPGPAGGYPLALAYHAGIMPDEDATFVGLGFSLNPGAINRSVSGFADDAKNVTSSTRQFWEGGSTTTVTVGVTLSAASGAGVSAGLIFSDDTYKGRGVGHYYGASYRVKQGPLSKGINHTQGVSPYGDRFSSTGATVGIGVSMGNGLMGGLSAGISQNQAGDVDASFSGGVSGGWQAPGAGKQAVGGTLLGASISTSQSSVSVTAAGVAAGATNTHAGDVSTSGSDIDVDIPISGALSIRLGKSYQRYWIDKTESVSSSGALYFPDDLPTSTQLNTRAYDVYDLADKNLPMDKSVPDESEVGAFIDYDNFNVVAQGLAGTMRPFHYQAALVRKNRKAGETFRVKSYPLMVNKKPHFRFIGDFSNRYEHDRAQDQFNISSNSSNPLSFSFDSNRKTGKSGNEAYDEDKNILPGSKNIEWFTNTSITYKWKDAQGNTLTVPQDAAIRKGFVDCKAVGFERSSDEKIGGFKITNESGVSYHYALPAYSRNESQYTGRFDDAGKHQFSHFRNPEPYAYTWLLTAVTGPDYVDTNTNGLADQGDYGYWVTFNYGYWSAGYNWRNPGRGFNKDIDQNFDTFSMGRKDVYYLNSVATQTHTAIFVKGFRHDGKGVVTKYSDAVVTGPGVNHREVDDEGFEPRVVDNGASTEYPTSTLKLNRIYLMRNKDLGGGAEKVTEFCSNGPGNFMQPGRMNVVDSLDVLSPIHQEILQKAIKTIEFVTDYSLCPNTENSFASDHDVYKTNNVASLARKGKLTLKAIKGYGKNGISLLPPTKFTYGKEEQMSGRINTSTVTIDHPERYNLKKGDIFRFRYLDKDYFFYLNGTVYSGGSYSVTPLNYTELPTKKLITTILTRTKNPPYSKDRQDLWGNYKVDWAPNDNQNAARMVTSTSAMAVDVWSLTEVSTALGSKIRFEYESDKYRNALKALSNIPIKSIERLSNGWTRVNLYENVSEYGLKQEDDVNFRAVTAARYEIPNASQVPGNRFDCNGVGQTYMMQWKFNNDHDVGHWPVNIASVDGTSFVLEYDFTTGFPRENDMAGVCFNEPYPYNTADGNHSATCIGPPFIRFASWQFIGGEIITTKFFTPYGGGLRVKKVSLVQENSTRSTMYEYENGVTTYEPVGFAVPLKKIPNSQIYQCLEQKQQDVFNLYRDQYRTDVFERFRFLFANSRELPGPNVMYGKVRVTEQIERPEGITKLPGMTEMEFEVFSPETIGVSGSSNPNLASAFSGQFTVGITYGGQSGTWSPTAIGNVPVDNIRTRNTAVIRDFSSIMGSLKRTTLYDQDYNKISETVNHYLHDNFADTTFTRKLGYLENQGVITETFVDARAIIKPDTETNPRYNLVAMISQKIKYPSVQTGTTTTNYKTGITTQSINKAFDYYSGNVTEVVTKDGFGNAYLQKTVPAYQSYGGINGDMGLGAFGGKNMLAQGSESWVYKVDTVNYEALLGVVSASVQTWSNDIPVIAPDQERGNATLNPAIWRKHANFVFMGSDDQQVQADGLYPVNQVTPFNAWNVGDSSPNGWDRTAALTLYDVFSNGLEEVNREGHYDAVKMSKDHSLVFARAVNAKYEEFAYSGAEDEVNNGEKFGGDVVMLGLLRSSNAHTGSWAVEADPQGSLKAKGFSYSFAPQQKSYHVSVWCNKSSSLIKYKFDNEATEFNANATVSGKAGNWYLIEADVIVGAGHTKLEVWCETASPQEAGPFTVFDDFRVHPTDAVMTSYVYNDQQQVSFILGNNNLFSEFRYDEAGRLIATRTESFQRSFGNDGHPGIVKVNDFDYHYGSATPKTVTFQSSATGATGSIVPAGATQVAQGTDVIFDLTGACPVNSYLQSVLIDGIAVSNNNAEITLSDGTGVEISSHMLKFKGVQAGHTIVANFSTETGLGAVECVGGVPMSDGTPCFDGQYRYGYYDACGEITTWSYAWQKTDIPADLRPMAVDNCCTWNPPGSTCACPDY